MKKRSKLKIITELVVRKKRNNFNRNWQFWHNFIITRNTLDAYLDIISKSFHQRNAKVPLWCRKHGLKHFCDLFGHTEFLLFLCSFRYWYQLICIKSNSHKIHVSLILWFSLYRCHRNIDFPKNQIVPNFNLRPVTGVNFTLIRVWAVA